MTDQEFMDRLKALVVVYVAGREECWLDVCVRFPNHLIWHVYDGETFVGSSQPRPQIDLQ